jgi:hypothetical protein
MWVVKALLPLCAALALTAFPVHAARLDLPPVPHYQNPLPSPPVAPIKPPNYTEPRSQGNTANNQDLNSITLWQRLMGIFDRTFEDPVTFLTLCLVIANFALALSTFGLWIVTARGSKRQSKDMSKSIGVAERALVSVERAFVFVKTLAQVPQFGHDGNIRSWAVVPILENSGSTPTKHLIYHISIDTPDEDLPEDFSFPDKWAEGVPMDFPIKLKQVAQP